MKNKLSIAIVFVFMAQTLQAQSNDLVTKASQFLNTLGSDLKSKAQYDFGNEERFNWHFVPRSRNGISFHEMNRQQKDAALALLKASLSDQGYQKATGIFALEKILQQVERRSDDDTYRDPKKYYFTVFGTPAKDQAWGWRVEGHHISINFSASQGELVSSTPTFMGSNPAIVPIGAEKGKQILKQETDLGFTLVNSLTQDQLKIALFSETALPEIVSGNKRKAELLQPEGIKFTALKEDQKKLLLQLLDVYVKNYQLGFSSKLMEKIKKAGIENLSFAWAGSLQPGDGHYYRIQGPMLLIEYDNTQAKANHVHTTVRDLTNDFAEDILKEHYLKEHH